MRPVGELSYQLPCRTLSCVEEAMEGWGGRDDDGAQVRFQQYAALFPEAVFVFVGDNGQVRLQRPCFATAP